MAKNRIRYNPTVARKKSAQDLSVDELRWMLMEKRRATRQQRIEHYRRTGRAMVVSPEVESPTLDDLRTGQLDDLLEGETETLATKRTRGRRFLDAFLLVVEISAVLGFLFVIFNGLSLIRELNKEVVTALVQPTLTPTPLVMAVVLPSGHTPPNAAGGAKPNEAEIPAHLRPLVQSLASLPMPTPGPEQAIRIQVPAIHIDAPVVQGDGWEQLKKGVAQHVGTADPGKTGNMVLSAHNDIFGEIFRYLDQLKVGDQVILFTNQRTYTYLVVDSKIVEPTDVEVMAPTAQSTVTLVSCYPYMVDNQRIVIVARLQSSSG
jgi:sortase A